MNLYYERQGRGEPLLLIHGLFSSGRAWRLLIDRLATERDVIVVDLPGHGRTPGPDGPAPTPAELADGLTLFLRDQGVDAAHLVGNSLGGWIALEMAKRGVALSVTALCPAGLWQPAPTRMCRMSLDVGTRAFQLASWVQAGQRAIPLPIAPTLTPPPRSHTLGQMAVKVTRHMLHSPYLQSQLRVVLSDAFRDGHAIPSPITVAWGDRDWVLAPLRTRRGHPLPPHTRWLTLPGCGHIPMYDNPGLIADLILASHAV